jgi:transposase
LGLAWRKVGTIPAKCDPVEQERFLKDERRPRLDDAEDGRGTVRFADAAHVIFGPYLGCIWCLVRLFVPGPSGRKRYNVLAALNAVTHEVIRVTNHTYINAESACAWLREVAGQVRGKVTLARDNARYQKCAVVGELAATLGSDLLYLPSYPPNLNRIERLWKYVKKACLGCRTLADDAAFTAAIDACLDNLFSKHKQQRDTLLTLNFQRFDDVPVLVA